MTSPRPISPDDPLPLSEAVGMDEAARLIGCSKAKLAQAIKRYPLYSRVGKRTTFYPEDIARLRRIAGETAAIDEIGRQSAIKHNQQMLDRVEFLRLSSFVYFIGTAEKKIKIGYATNLPVRLKGMQSGCPDQLLIFGVVPGARTLERELHDRFASCRFRGEWFHLTDEIGAYIQEKCIR